MLATFALATLLSAPAALAGEAALLKVTRGSGYVPPEWAFRVNCDVNAGHTMYALTRGKKPTDFTYRETVYTAALPDEAAVKAALLQAERGRLRRSQGPVDGPSNVYVGVIEGEVVNRHVRLRQDSTGGDNYENEARQVRDLVELANENCPYPAREQPLLN